MNLRVNAIVSLELFIPYAQVDTETRLTGITAAQFNTDANKAAFKTAVEDSLTIYATVTNIVAIDASRRRSRMMCSTRWS